MTAAPADAAVSRPAGGHAAPAPSPRPPLRVVRPRSTPPRAPFVVLVALLLGGGLVAVLLVNTWLAQGSFEIRRLQAERTSVQIQAQALAGSLAAESAPGALAAKAAALGLVPAPNPVFKTASGAVLGTPNKAVRPAPPPPPSPAAQPSAQASPSVAAQASTSASIPPSVSASASASAKPAPPAAQPKPAATPAGTSQPTKPANPATPAKPANSTNPGSHG